jgi:hypothetical protein
MVYGFYRHTPEYRYDSSTFQYEYVSWWNLPDKWPSATPTPELNIETKDSNWDKFFT